MPLIKSLLVGDTKLDVEAASENRWPVGVRTYGVLSEADYESEGNDFAFKHLCRIPFRKRCGEAAIEALSGSVTLIYAEQFPSSFSVSVAPSLRAHSVDALHVQLQRRLNR